MNEPSLDASETRYVVNLVPIYNGEPLFGYKHREGANPMWIPLGGKREPWETDKECLERELREETKGIDPQKLMEDMKLLWTFEGTTPNGNPLETTVYTSRVDTLLHPNAEIQKIEPFPRARTAIEPLVSETTQRIAKAMYQQWLVH